MPATTIMPSSPGLGGLGSPGLGKRTPAPHENGRHTRTMSAAQNGVVPLYDDTTTADIKNAAIDSVRTKARHASPMSLIKATGSQYQEGKHYESNGDPKKALFAYYQAVQLARMVVELPEKDRHGVIQREIDDFFGTIDEVSNRLKKVEEKLKTADKPSSNVSGSANGALTLADRMRALKDNGLDITSKRLPRNTSDTVSPSPPKSSTPTSLPSPLVLLPPLKPSPPGSSVSSPHTLVSPSQLGPPSPSSSPTLSPQLDAIDTPEFTTFPSIEELDERADFSLPSASLLIEEPQTTRNTPSSTSPPSSSSPSYPTSKPFPLPNERPPPSTPVFSGISSLPGSPSKSSMPLKPSSHFSFPHNKEIPGKSFIPVKDTATPTELSEYMREHRNILLLDVRNRIDFEKEHIKAVAVACIEPFPLLRENLNIQQLEESIALSKHEYGLFSNRDKFDIVVVYDDSSIVLGGRESPLSNLVRLIGGRSGHKVLRRAPMLLVGGLNAWKQLFSERLERRAVPPSSLPNTPIPYTSIQQQIWTPQASHINIMNGHHINGSVDQVANHIRSPAEISYPTSPPFSNQTLTRKAVLLSPISHTKSTDNLGSPALQSGPFTNGSINYPQMPKRPAPLPHLLLGSGTMSSSNIISPPLASVNPSLLSRKRSDYPDPSQEALSSYARASIDYPRLSAPQVPRPPPAAASSARERQDTRYIPFSPTEAQKISPHEVTIWLDWPNSRITPRGLSNLGNTCWMNSIVQCLNVTAPFANYFLDGRWRSFVDPNKGRLTVAYAQLLQHMRSAGDQKHIVPSQFHDTICQLMPHFEKGKQHDSQEFLGSLLDRIDEDLKPLAKPEPLMIQKPADNALPATRSSKNGIIANCFQSECSSRLQCSICETTSVTYEHFNFLQLSVPHVRENSPQKVSVYTCLEEFFREEIMEKENQWLCPKCNKSRIASKKVSLTRPPAVLILHLKRYTHDSWGERMIRNNAFVDFPLDDLDLTRFVSPATPPDGHARLPPIQMPPCKYRLYGVTNHSGSESLDRGHYTALISSDGGWLKFSDTNVSGPFNPREIISSEAYVLFYRRVKS